jgi:hypothetical protein
MASIFEKEPLFLLERTWDDMIKMPEKHKFSGDSGKKAEVYINSGSSFMNKLQWSWSETFSKFENVFAGSYKTAWREVVQEHFTPLPNASKEELKKSFFSAVHHFVCTLADRETPRDLQYVYMDH